MKMLIRCAAAVALLMSPIAAQAAITCSVASGGFATAYDPGAPGVTVVQTFFTVTCTKGSASDPNTRSYSVRVNNGLYAQAQNNRAAFGGNRIRYEAYRDAGCSSRWQGATTISGTVATPSVGTFTQTSYFFGCVGAGIAAPAGTYTDMVTMTMTYGASTAVGSFNVSISTPATCGISSPPGNVVFNYVSFGPAINPSATFGVTCTLSLPYTMALDATAGTLVGLNYTLALSTNSSTGTGVQQTHSINGSMAAGQSGVCAVGPCVGTQARSLTITY